MKKNALALTKRLLGGLISLCLLVSCALPALAEDPAVVQETITLTAGTNQNGAGWSWDGTNKLLTLSGVTMNVTGKNGFVLPVGSSVHTKDGTANKITVSGENAVAFSVTGTQEAGKAAFTLNGDGQLTIAADSSKKITDASSCAVGQGIVSLPVHTEGAVTVTQTGGILFRGTAGTAASKNVLTSNLDLTGKTLTISENAAVIVPDGISITNSGNITNKGKLAYGGTAEQAKAPELSANSLPTGTSYRVDISPPNGGTIAPLSNGAYHSGAITLSCTPNPDYVLESFTVNGKDITGDTFTPTAPSTVSARLRPVVKVASLTATLNNTSVHVGSSTGLSVTVGPTNADDKEYTVTSSDSSVATVVNNGGWLVNGIAPGTATITVTSEDGGATTQTAITVDTAPTVSVDTVAFVPEIANHTLKQGESKQLFVAVKPDTATDKSVTFTSSDSAVATVDANGNVTGVGVGTATITAKAGDKTATCTFTVTPAVSATGIVLNLTTLTLPVNETYRLIATMTPADAADTVTFTSSNTAVAAVQADGTVTAIAPGSATITATTSGGQAAQCAVTVTPITVPVGGVALDSTTLTLTEGLVGKLTATVLPTDASDKAVTFTSSDPTVATVDANGLVTACKPGTAVITAKAGDKTASCTVTVNSAVVPVTGITLNRSGLAMTKGQAETLTATVKPDNATQKAVTFTSSNPAVATVNSQGRVVAVAAGTAVITAKAGDKTVQCPVAVTVPVTGVSLNRASVGVLPGAVFTLTATVQPADASNKAVTFTSTNTRVATVDQTGKVTALTAGTAEIIATAAGGHMSRCSVTVSAPSQTTDDSITGDAFWDRIVDRLDNARSGATVAVNAGSRLDIPTAVLEELDGTNNTLLIHWSGRDISIDGRDMDDLDFDRDTYALRTLSGLYGISKEEEEEFEEEDWDDFEFEEIYFEDDEPTKPADKEDKPASNKTDKTQSEKDDQPKKDEPKTPPVTDNNTTNPPQNGSSSQNSTPTQNNTPSGSNAGTTSPGTSSDGENQGSNAGDSQEKPPMADSMDDIDMTPVEGEDATPSAGDGTSGSVLAPAPEEKKQNHWGTLAIAGAGVVVVGSSVTAVCLRIRSKKRWDDVPF